ncbi:MAG TPA: response regulator transcription factor [Chloroflexaceae bacterium]|nr:response regulator transcription factor [Chloroflexaceae bacterium]
MSVEEPGLDILVIDDDLAMLELLTSVLEDEGYAARAATSGPSGLKMLAEAPPALVLLDWMMPTMRGDEVLRAIRAGAHRDLPVVILSANGDARALLAEGADEFLAKPFDLDELLACVARHLPPP